MALPHEAVVQTMPVMSVQHQTTFLLALPEESSTRIIHDLNAEDRAHVVSMLPSEKQEALISALPAEEQAQHRSAVNQLRLHTTLPPDDWSVSFAEMAPQRRASFLHAQDQDQKAATLIELPATHLEETVSMMRQHDVVETMRAFVSQSGIAQGRMDAAEKKLEKKSEQ